MKLVNIGVPLTILVLTLMGITSVNVTGAIDGTVGNVSKPRDTTNSFECSNILDDATQIRVVNVSLVILHSRCFEEATNCIDIVLKENHMIRIEADAWMGLDHLDSLTIEDNNLQSILIGTFIHLTKIRFLSLNRNDIQTIEKNAWLYLGNLKYLELKENRLSVITANMFSHLQSLTRLKLQQNNIKRIKDGAWLGLESLYALYLSHNDLTVIHSQMFRSLPEAGNGWNLTLPSREPGFNTSLYEPHLDNNEISEIEPGTFSELDGLTY